MSGKYIKITPIAETIPFDNETNGFIAENVQEAIEEISNSIKSNYLYSRSNILIPNTWLLNGNIPSNVSGTLIYTNNTQIEKIFVSNEIVNNFDISIYSHDGNNTNLVLLGTVNIISSKGQYFPVSWNVAINKQIAVRLTSGMAKNCIVGLALKGTV